MYAVLCSCNTNYNPDISRLPQTLYTLGINFCIIFHNGTTTHLVLSYWMLRSLQNRRGSLPTGLSLVPTPNLNAGEHSDIGEWSAMFLKDLGKFVFVLFCFVEQAEQKLV